MSLPNFIQRVNKRQRFRNQNRNLNYLITINQLNKDTHKWVDHDEFYDKVEQCILSKGTKYKLSKDYDVDDNLFIKLYIS